jgi:hypothetical protein
MSQVPPYLQFDGQRVSAFLEAYGALTWKRTHEERSSELDHRIQRAGLSLADKIQAFKRLGASGATLDRTELRMERLLYSIDPQDLCLFKFALEYDGDYKDLEEYLWHDIDDKTCRARIIDHLRTGQALARGIKVLSDVDDTMYANLFDGRYPKTRTLYPGLLEFYAAMKREPFESEGIPVTILSARPNPVGGLAEEGSLKSLAEYSSLQLRPSALSGEVVSSTLGTLESFVRTRLGGWLDRTPHQQEDAIGLVKFERFEKFSGVYPEYHYVFVGDSGQADALTARMMLDAVPPDGSSRVITTFIHDLGRSADDRESRSDAFRRLDRRLAIGKTSPVAAGGRGVIIFRNYIEAATIAYLHSTSLDTLITAADLARITRAALEGFDKIGFEAGGSREELLRQYREDATDAYTRLALLPGLPDSCEADMRALGERLSAGPA